MADLFSMNPNITASRNLIAEFNRVSLFVHQLDFKALSKLETSKKYAYVSDYADAIVKEIKIPEGLIPQGRSAQDFVPHFIDAVSNNLYRFATNLGISDLSDDPNPNNDFAIFNINDMREADIRDFIEAQSPEFVATLINESVDRGLLKPLYKRAAPSADIS